MKKIYLLSTFLFFAFGSYSQINNEEQFIKDSIETVKIKLIRPQIKFDNRINFYGSQALPITGFDVGVLLAEKLRVTLGYYNMNNSLKEKEFAKNDTAYGTLIHLEYGSINTELMYKDTRFLSLGLPLEIGAGMNTFRDKNITADRVLKTRSGALIFVNFGISATFKPMRFLGLKGIVGYRKMAYNQVKEFNFDGLFTSIGLNVDLHALTTQIKMFNLKKRYHRGNNITNAVDILTN
ncbi:MAG: hypothetical protein K0Q95_2289 [Bacteroidota bacterium]|jgi:hypothetical protein|nr:hypothetical protein [Bacteroidota bacterium]